MTSTLLLFAAVLAAPPPASTMSMPCALAVRAVVDVMRANARRSGLPATMGEFAATYSSVECTDPQWASGEIFVHVTPVYRPLTYHAGRDYVVRPNGEVELLRGRPCKLNPEACG